MKKIYNREYYLKKIRGFYDSDLIKVISGVRRCGKSCFLESVINDLKKRGVPENDIVYINLDMRGFRSVTTADQLDELIAAKLPGSKMKYLFIDEIQNVKDFEPVINGFREEGNVSIFITGSNSYLLSGELATKLTGRYIEIEMFPLNFGEYLEMKAFLGKTLSDNKAEEFDEYLRFGGFPKTLEFDDPVDKELYVKDVIEQIFEKDILKFRKIRNRSLFERVMNYIINNFGATTNLQNILRYFRNEEGIPIKQETLHGYIKILENAKIIYKCPRFDIKSRKSLKGEQKYYLADLSICFSRNVDRRINYGPALENIVYTYLTSRGYSMSVGRIGKLECDFITRKNMDYYYIQVAMTIAERKTEDREYAPFEEIRDNYPKYLFTLDPLLQRRDGVKHCNIINFIAKCEELL